MGYESESILVDRAGAIATITLNRPEARNAIDFTTREELAGAHAEVETDESIRVLILTGAGGHFSAGGDVKTSEDHPEGVRVFLEKRPPKFTGR